MKTVLLTLATLLGLAIGAYAQTTPTPASGSGGGFRGRGDAFCADGKTNTSNRDSGNICRDQDKRARAVMKQPQATTAAQRTAPQTEDLLLVYQSTDAPPLRCGKPSSDCKTIINLASANSNLKQALEGPFGDLEHNSKFQKFKKDSQGFYTLTIHILEPAQKGESGAVKVELSLIGPNGEKWADSTKSVEDALSRVPPGIGSVVGTSKQPE